MNFSINFCLIPAHLQLIWTKTIYLSIFESNDVTFLRTEARILVCGSGRDGVIENVENSSKVEFSIHLTTLTSYDGSWVHQFKTLWAAPNIWPRRSMKVQFFVDMKMIITLVVSAILFDIFFCRIIGCMTSLSHAKGDLVTNGLPRRQQRIWVGDINFFVFLDYGLLGSSKSHPLFSHSLYLFSIYSVVLTFHFVFIFIPLYVFPFLIMDAFKASQPAALCSWTDRRSYVVLEYICQHGQYIDAKCSSATWVAVDQLFKYVRCFHQNCDFAVGPGPRVGSNEATKMPAFCDVRVNQEIIHWSVVTRNLPTIGGWYSSESIFH